MDPLIGAFGVTLVAGCGFDLRERRIPNLLTYGALACALVLRLGLEGYDVQAGVLGAALGLPVGFVLFAVGALGAGDAKLFMAVGAFLGPVLLVRAMALSALAGGALGVYYAWRAGLLWVLFVNLRELAIYGVTLGTRGSRRSLADSPVVLTMPYGLAIAAGSAAALLQAGGIS